MLKLKIILCLVVLGTTINLSHQEGFLKFNQQQPTMNTAQKITKVEQENKKLEPSVLIKNETDKMNVTGRQLFSNQAPVVTIVQDVSPISPFLIQQPVVSWTGEVIIETSIGGIPFDCSMRPTGHWRDTNFCDIYHACVWGNQRKTYVCPVVGERTYFDEITQRCEFVHTNPSICMANSFEV